MKEIRRLNSFAQASILLLACVFFQTYAVASQSAGKITSAFGEVRAYTQKGEARKLTKNSEIFSGDLIRTQSSSSVRMRFFDGSRFSLGPNSEMVVDSFVNAKTGNESSFTTRILKGTFRFVSGLIARRRPEAMGVRLSVATIGIRGTHVAGEVKPAEVDEAGKVIKESSATVVLMEPEEEGKKTAIEVSNAYGSVVIDEPGHGTEIPDEHSPPSPVRKMQLRTVNNIMRALRSSTRRVNTPRPRMP